MKSLIALIRREQIEHRAAFLYAPAIVLGLFAVTLAMTFAMNRMQVPLAVSGGSALKFFTIAFLFTGALWMTYLMMVLFFYFADAFNADRRNNAMLFWKSMPQSDFKILMSKLLAALTILPVQVFAAFILTGVVLYAATAAATLVLPALAVPGVAETIGAAGQVLWFSAVYAVLALLWYAPFFAWVGALSTVAGRWSIPLAFLIPGLVVLAENLFVRGLGNLILPMDGMRGGQVLGYLRQRLTFGVDDHDMFERAMTTDAPVDVGGLLARFLAGIDWVQLGGGVIVAVLLVYIASEYRRRVVLT
ncbi:MAG TPA: hypothetical protein PK286_05940 [Devosia sp.]|mgnify:CR=1 FL=1|nr:hypothetical protein [Devosia sp.]